MIEQRIENNLEIHILDNILIKNFVCVCTDNTWWSFHFIRYALLIPHSFSCFEKCKTGN